MSQRGRRQWHPTPVLLPGKSHGWRSLVGCSPWGHEESDMTERLHFHFSLSWIGEGNGNPLQCSCLESPSDSRAWWAAAYGVTQSRTRLKRLSRSSSIDRMCFPKFISWNLTAYVMVLGGGDLGIWLGHESRTFVSEISVHIKETQRVPLLLSPWEDRVRKWLWTRE